MGNRLSKITTRTGDKGSTGLADGSRLPKDHARIAALGDLLFVLSRYINRAQTVPETLWKRD